MTPKEICEILLVAPHLTDDVLGPLCEYRRAKGATGAPTDLESTLIQAARDCQRCADDLRAAFADVAREASRIEAGIGTRGTMFVGGIFATGRHFSLAALERLEEKRDAFDTLVKAWALVADRVQATAEERAQTERERRAALAARWASCPWATLRKAQKTHNVKGDSKAVVAAELAALGIEPTA